MSLRIVPCTLTEAKVYVTQHHRHHDPPTGGLFAVACANDSGIVGVAVVSRPIARMLQDGWTAEVTRLWNRLLVIGPLLIGWWATPQTEDRK